MQMIINEDLKNEIEQLKEITEQLEKVKDTTQKLQFVTIKELSKITGMSIPTVQKLFNRSDFPSCSLGKEKIAEVNAVREFFKERR